MKKLTLLLIVLVLLVGCAPRPFTPPTECVNQPSFILETAPDPAALSKGLLIVNLASLETIKGYSVDDAYRVIDQVDSLVSKADMTYLEIGVFLMQKADIANSLAGSLIFIVGDDIKKLSSPLPINICDVALIRAHLSKQRMLIALYAAGK